MKKVINNLIENCLQLEKSFAETINEKGLPEEFPLLAETGYLQPVIITSYMPDILSLNEPVGRIGEF
jgi:hypothetical protein